MRKWKCDKSSSCEDPCSCIAPRPPTVFLNSELTSLLYSNFITEGIKQVVNLGTGFILLSPNNLYQLPAVGGVATPLNYNLLPEQLVAFNGGILALKNGVVYSGTLTGSTMTWVQIPSLPTPITFMNSTTDVNNSYLWLQTTTQGYLYDSALTLQPNFPISIVNGTRVYGTTPTTYAEASYINNFVKVISGTTETPFYDVAGFAFEGDTFRFFTLCQVKYYSGMDPLVIGGIPSVVWLSAYQCL
jgi:hypothetical protein